MKPDFVSVALIPARGGSKGLQRKNLLTIAGKSLLQMAVECAQEASIFELIVVTTEDPEISQEAIRLGAVVINRPAELAKDDSLIIDVIRHARGEITRVLGRLDVLVLLQPTSPLRKSDDVVAVVERLKTDDVDCVATFVETGDSPYSNWIVTSGVAVQMFPSELARRRRQDLPESFVLNGAVYAFKTKLLDDPHWHFLNGKVGANLMPRERSIDIDDEYDFEIARFLIERGRTEG